MTAREKMVAFREKNSLTLKAMSIRSGVSVRLLEMVEHGHVTHPSIAKRIKNAYKLSEDDLNELMPGNYVEGANYDPDKYKAPEPNRRP